jgi:hypothetical protein
MDIGDRLPDQIADLLEQRLRSKDRRTNLIESGCLPESALSACERPTPMKVGRA